jgi:hypothetical protein
MNMTDKDFENIIKDSLKISATPDHATLTTLLSKLDTQAVGDLEIHHDQRASLLDIISIWRSKRIVLIPSFMLVVLVGIFTLSPRAGKYDSGIAGLLIQDELIEKESVNYDSQISLPVIESKSFDSLNAIQNEI